jgi:hypothetical protein
MAEHPPPKPPDAPVSHQAVVVPPAHPTPSDPPHAAPAAPSSAPSTRRPPLPDPRRLATDAQPVTVPAFETFSFSAGRPLSPEEVQTITLFHEQCHQRRPEDWTTQTLRDAKHDAETVLPLMRRQLELASQSHEGARGAEARQIQANIEWVEQLVAL